MIIFTKSTDLDELLLYLTLASTRFSVYRYIQISLKNSCQNLIFPIVLLLITSCNTLEAIRMISMDYFLYGTKYSFKIVHKCKINVVLFHSLYRTQINEWAFFKITGKYPKFTVLSCYWFHSKYIVFSQEPTLFLKDGYSIFNFSPFKRLNKSNNSNLMQYIEQRYDIPIFSSS